MTTNKGTVEPMSWFYVMKLCCVRRRPAECFTEVDMSERKRTLERVKQVWETGQPITNLPKETWMELCAMFDINVCEISRNTSF